MTDKIFSIIFLVMALAFIITDMLIGENQSPMVLGLMVLSKVYSISYELEDDG